MAPLETRFAHRSNRSSVSGVANRVSSTTLSIAMAPDANAADRPGSSGRWWAASIHLRAFHSEMP
jgi:hypothetical protein